MDTLVLCGTEDRDNGSAPNLVAALPNATLAEVPGTHMSSVTRARVRRRAGGLPRPRLTRQALGSNRFSTRSFRIDRGAPACEEAYPVRIPACAGDCRLHHHPAADDGRRRAACRRRPRRAPNSPPPRADAFVAAVEKDLFDYTVEASQVNWVNATYITEDTDALAARINAIGTEKTVKYALEAAKYAASPGPRRPTPSASSTSCATASSCRRRPRRARRPSSTPSPPTSSRNMARARAR